MKLERKSARAKIKDIADIKSFDELIENSTLSDEEKYILREHYLKNKTFTCIGDDLGYVESTMIKKHKKILNKLSKILK